MTESRHRRPLILILLLTLTASGCYRALSSVIRHPVTADYPIESDTFRDTIGNLLSAPLVEGNDIVELKNGDKIFSSMIRDIRTAQKTITLEQYIWSSGAVADLFIPELVERAHAGVRIYVTVDAVGSQKLKAADIKKLKDAGIQVSIYNSVLFSRFYQAQHRTHRKLLVIDGRVGYIGGVCMSDPWRGNAEPELKRWRDTHFRVEGPVVGQIQRAFLDNWIEMRSEVLHGADFFPHIEPKGKIVAQCFVSGPHGGADNARMNLLVSFAAARKNIRISHAYFSPDPFIVKELLAARKRGVDVEIIFPKKIDNRAVAKASRKDLRTLLDAGVKIYQYTPTLYHCKIAIVDDVWSMVGSVNLDQRSLRINDEASLNVRDAAFAAKLIESFEDDKRNSEPLTIEALKKRNIFSKVTDGFFGALRSEL